MDYDPSSPEISTFEEKDENRIEQYIDDYESKEQERNGGGSMEIEETRSIDLKSGYSLLHGNEREEEIGHRLITNIETMGDIDTIDSIQVFERNEQEWIDRQDEVKDISRDEWRSGYVPPSSCWRDYILNST